MKLIKWLVFGLLFICCEQKPKKLHAVTVRAFERFIKETGYETDAQKYGWSIVQKDVFNYSINANVNWRNPSGMAMANPEFPVTQVSYNDAMAYCEWANVRLPTYDEYWEYAAKDTLGLNINANTIRKALDYNVVGNVWDITTTENQKKEIRLAGGSYLCNKNTCDGSNPQRRLFVDKTTGNSHIGFSVISD